MNRSLGQRTWVIQIRNFSFEIFTVEVLKIHPLQLQVFSYNLHFNDNKKLFWTTVFRRQKYKMNYIHQEIVNILSLNMDMDHSGSQTPIFHRQPQLSASVSFSRYLFLSKFLTLFIRRYDQSKVGKHFFVHNTGIIFERKVEETKRRKKKDMNK